MSVELNKPGNTVMNDLDILDSLMSYYHSVFKSMPAAGDNSEFVDALVGMNDKGVQVLPHDHPSINQKGELVDRWGTAYFFHPMSDKETQIISAGPDRTCSPTMMYSCSWLKYKTIIEWMSFIKVTSIPAC